MSAVFSSDCTFPATQVEGIKAQNVKGQIMFVCMWSEGLFESISKPSYLSLVYNNELKSD